MAGTISGRINCISVIPAGPNDEQRNCRARQERFTSLWQFLLTQSPRITLVASNYGVNAGNTGAARAGGAVDYWDAPSTLWLGHGAWSVWRFNNAQKPWYLFIQLDIGGGAAIYDGGNMLVISGGSGGSITQLGIQSAWATDAGGNIANPWNGTTSANGTDSPWPLGAPNSPRWVAPVGGKVYVLPRENNTSGNFDSLKNSAAGLGYRIFYIGYSDYAYGVVCDDDSILFFCDPNNSNEWSLSLIASYAPRSGYTVPIPRIMLAQNPADWGINPGLNRIPFNPIVQTNGAFPYVAYGNINAAADSYTGGISIPSTNPNDNIRIGFIQRSPLSYQAPFNPGSSSGQNRYDEWQLTVGAYENSLTPTAAIGVLGDLDPIYREVYNVGSSDTNANLTRVFLGGQTSLANIKASLPWDGVTVPRNYGVWPASREGVTF